MKKTLIPFSYLFLYSKGWIRFRNSKGFVDDMRRICEMDGYICSKNPTGLVLHGFVCIKEWLQKNGVELSPSWTDISYFYRCANARAVNEDKEYGVSELEMGMMREVYGNLQMISKIPQLAIKHIDYRAWKVCLACTKHGMTYKYMQEHFNSTWKSSFVTESFETPWCIKNYR